jgi:hypothetical protein
MEARGSSDRRRRPTPIFSRYTFFGGRRKRARRKDDRDRHVFVDLYGTPLWILLLAVITLSTMDGYLTLILLSDNLVVEANPIMAFFIGLGSGPFVVAKLLITSVPIIVFCVCKNIPTVRVAMLSALAIYAAVIAYELKIYHACYGF